MIGAAFICWRFGLITGRQLSDIAQIEVATITLVYGVAKWLT